jgi:hypothetical protein
MLSSNAGFFPHEAPFTNKQKTSPGQILSLFGPFVSYLTLVPGLNGERRNVLMKLINKYNWKFLIDVKLQTNILCLTKATYISTVLAT